MFRRLRVLGTLLVAVGYLSACSGANNTQPFATSPRSATGPAGPSAVSGPAAPAAWQRANVSNAMTVTPSSLALTLPTAQTLTVTVNQRTTVFAASSDRKIVTVSPDYVTVKSLMGGVGTATFTVTPHAVGKATIGIIDRRGMYVVVPATVESGKIYVANSGNNTVTTYNADGSASTPTISAGLNGPIAVAVDAAGKIYVANDTNTMTKYNAVGKRIMPTISDGNPLGVAVDTAGKIYLANYFNNTVTTYNPDGTPTTPTIAGLNNPSGVAVDAAGKIYVTDNASVTTYNADGTQTTPTITAGLTSPAGIAVDAAGKIYVANYDTNTVVTYNADGTQATPTISAGLSDPFGVAVDAAGKIYVSNAGNNTVTTYNADGTQTTPTISGLNSAGGIAVR